MGGLHRLNQPALRGIDPHGQDGLLWEISKPGHWARGQTTIRSEGQVWLQHIAIITSKNTTCNNTIIGCYQWMEYSVFQNMEDILWFLNGTSLQNILFHRHLWQLVSAVHVYLHIHVDYFSQHLHKETENLKSIQTPSKTQTEIVSFWVICSCLSWSI